MLDDEVRISAFFSCNSSELSYGWTPWYYLATDGNDDGPSADGIDDDGEEAPMNAYELDDRFNDNCNIGPILEPLLDYLTPSTPHSCALKILTIKQLNGRGWPTLHTEAVRKLCGKPT
jgi:hypothetical protein